MRLLTELMLTLWRLLVELRLLEHPYLTYLTVTLPATVLTLGVLAVYGIGTALWRFETDRHP